MSGFAIRTPYLIVVACLMIFVLGVSSVARMPVDMILLVLILLMLYQKVPTQ